MKYTYILPDYTYTTSEFTGYTNLNDFEASAVYSEDVIADFRAILDRYREVEFSETTMSCIKNDCEVLLRSINRRPSIPCVLYCGFTLDGDELTLYLCKKDRR